MVVRGVWMEMSGMATGKREDAQGMESEVGQGRRDSRPLHKEADQSVSLAMRPNANTSRAGHDEEERREVRRNGRQ